MHVQISYPVNFLGVLNGQVEQALESLAEDLQGECICRDWTLDYGPVYRQMVFHIPGGDELGSLAGKFCRRACEYLEYRGIPNSKFGPA